jgi:hypothetical protein
MFQEYHTVSHFKQEFSACSLWLKFQLHILKNNELQFKVTSINYETVFKEVL